MKLEYIYTSTVAHGDGSGTAKVTSRKKAKAKRAGSKGSTQKMARDIATVHRGSQVDAKKRTTSQAKKGMIKSIRQAQAKKANYQHEG
jgi:hypothetical protein